MPLTTKSNKIFLLFICVFGSFGLTSLDASFQIYGRAMAKSGLSQTHASGENLIESSEGSSIIIDLNSSDYRYRRALNIRNIPSTSVASVKFSIDGVEVSEDFNEPYMLYSNSSWLPAEGSYSIVAKYFNANGIQIGQEILTVIINEPLSHRKRKVFIATGVPNQSVQLKMKNHEYIFGSQTVESWTLSDTNPNDPTATQRKPYPIRISGTELNGNALNPNSLEMQLTEKYREIFLQNFNFSVAGNVMKWYSNGESELNLRMLIDGISGTKTIIYQYEAILSCGVEGRRMRIILEKCMTENR